MPDMQRSLLLSQFNESYMYGADVREVGKGQTVFMYIVQNKLADYLENYQYAYLRRVLRFCFSTDFYKKTGLSVKDLMTLDLATFEYIEKEFRDFKPVERDALEDLMRDLEKTGKESKKK